MRREGLTITPETWAERAWMDHLIHRRHVEDITTEQLPAWLDGRIAEGLPLNLEPTCEECLIKDVVYDFPVGVK